jgi:hypothetical protein
MLTDISLILCVQVGFWTIRVVAENQMEEKQIKVEHYYNPKFEVFVRIAPFVLDTEEYIEASVKAVYTFEKLAKGHVHLRWYARQTGATSWLYNDTVQYRESLFNIYLIN